MDPNPGKLADPADPDPQQWKKWKENLGIPAVTEVTFGYSLSWSLWLDTRYSLCMVLCSRPTADFLQNIIFPWAKKAKKRNLHLRIIDIFLDPGKWPLTPFSI
jgi:hypothetical protein